MAGMAGTAGGSAGGGSGGSGGDGSVACPSGGFAWPGGAQAAVSLTYDDSLESQLKYAVPVLDAAGIGATFFLSEGYFFTQHSADFGALLASGHELASHTVKHPCFNSGTDLALYTSDQMAAELDANLQSLRGLGVTAAKPTFAYPCGQSDLGNPKTSYVSLVQERFAAARGTTWAVAAPSTVDLFNVPSAFPPETSTGADIVALIQSAESSAGWVVVGMHGISSAGEYLNLSQPAHDAIVSYLTTSAAKIWTAPFGTVAEYVARCR